MNAIKQKRALWLYNQNASFLEQFAQKGNLVDESAIVFKHVHKLDYPQDLPNSDDIDLLVIDASITSFLDFVRVKALRKRYPQIPIIKAINKKDAESLMTHLYQQQSLDNQKRLEKHITQRSVFELPTKAGIESKGLEAAQLMIDTMPAHVALLNQSGAILAVNAAWQHFNFVNSPTPYQAVGKNYLAICQAATGADAAEAAVFAEQLRAILKGEQHTYQYLAPCHSPNEQRWFIGRISRLMYPVDEIQAVVSFENVSEERLANISLKKFSQAVEQSPVSILFTDKEGRIEYANPKITELTGYSPEELLGQNPRIFKSGLTDAAVIESLWATINSGEAWYGELQNCKKDGTLFWESAAISPLWDSSGEITNFIGVKQDITRQKIAESLLAASEKRYRSLFENSAFAILLTDENGRILDANKQSCSLLEYGLSELKTLSLSDIDPLEYTKLRPNNQSLVKPEGYTLFETILISKRGKTIPIEMSIQYISLGEKTVLLSICRDISERKNAIKAEKEARSFARALAETAVILNSSVKTNQLLPTILENVNRILNFEIGMIMSLEEELAQVVDVKTLDITKPTQSLTQQRIIVSDDRTLSSLHQRSTPLILNAFGGQAAWQTLFQDGSLKSFIGVAISTNDTTLGFITLASSKPFAFSDEDSMQLQAFANQMASVMQNARLYTQLETFNEQLDKQIQQQTEQLRHEKVVLEAVLHNSPNGIVFTDLNGRIQLANTNFYETFSLTKPEVQGNSLGDILNLPDSQALQEKADTALTTQKKQAFTTRVTLKNGENQIIEIHVAPITNNGLSGFVYTIQNVTQAYHDERAKDRFVSNVSHEFRSPITSLKLYHQLLRKNPHKAQEYVSHLERETERLNRLVEDLLRLSHLDQNQIISQPFTIDLNLISQSLAEDRNLLAEKEGLCLHVTPLEQPALVSADLRMIEQVLSIFLDNAISYSPADEGQIEIRTVSQVVEEELWHGIAVKDNGIGIPENEQSKVFDRFFRGEAVDSVIPGTGLGLSIAAEMMSQQGGKIEVESAGVRGKGSTFTLWLPALTP